jgi:hypothetical protein
MLVTAHNRGAETAKLSLLPQLCCRNTWSWQAGTPKPALSASGRRRQYRAPGVGQLPPGFGDGDGEGAVRVIARPAAFLRERNQRQASL